MPLHKKAIESTEKVILDVKKHWIYLMPSLLILIFSVIISFLIISGRGILINENILQIEHIYVIVSTLILVGIFFASRGYIQWQFSFYQITTRRIRSIQLCRGYQIIIREALFDLVKSIEEDKPGIMASLLGYAHIKINTDSMASDSLLQLRYIHHAEILFKKIEKLIASNA